MTSMQSSETKTEYSLKEIEILKSSINTPEATNLPVANYQFAVSLETKIDPSAKLIFVVVNIDITSEESKLILASTSVSCIYQIVNFEEVIKQNAENKYEIPPKLLEKIGDISFSTTRGIMFATFKGTFLHNAILPLIDLQKFKQQ